VSSTLELLKIKFKNFDVLCAVKKNMKLRRDLNKVSVS
jgi:hypothetical protein